MIKHLKPKSEKEINACLKPGQSRRSWDVENIIFEFYIENLFEILNVDIFKNQIEKKLSSLNFETKLEMCVENYYLIGTVWFKKENDNNYTVINFNIL